MGEKSPLFRPSSRMGQQHLALPLPDPVERFRSAHSANVRAYGGRKAYRIGYRMRPGSRSVDYDTGMDRLYSIES